jgi:CRISPR/Cas system-associated protein endoribonuclease Cas2
MTYALDLKLYDEFREQAGYTMKQFVGYVKTLKKTKDPKHEMRNRLDKINDSKRKQKL